MTSISRGLYRWIVCRTAVLEDFADRLNHFWTVTLLCLLACIISWKQNYGDPIKCWCPAQFTDSMVDYAHACCWNSHIIQYPEDVGKTAFLLNVPNPYGDMMDLKPFVSDYNPQTFYLDSPYLDLGLLSSTVTLYQWLPLILCFQALLFKLPHIIMHSFHGFTGVSFDKITGLTAGYDKLNLGERQDMGKQVARYIYRWRVSCDNCLPYRLLTCLWLLVKTLFCVNILTQMVILNKYLRTNNPPLYHTTSFWDAISTNLFYNNATLWKTSKHFPRKIVCDFSIRQLANIQRYSVQCQLPANEFNECVYMFLWVWFVIVAVVTYLSALVWLVKTLIPVSRQRYITKALEIDEEFSRTSHHQNDNSKFCDVIGEDGVMALKLVGANSSELLVRDVVCFMWSQYSRKAGDICVEKVEME